MDDLFEQPTKPAALASTRPPSLQPQYSGVENKNECVGSFPEDDRDLHRARLLRRQTVFLIALGPTPYSTRLPSLRAPMPSTISHSHSDTKDQRLSTYTATMPWCVPF